MPSKIELCNRALAHIGSARIASMEESSAESSACNTFYSAVRQKLLRMHPWQFAQQTQTLALSVDVPPDYACAYEKPAGCLRVVKVFSGSQEVPFAMRGNKLLSNHEGVSACYVADIDDPTQYDSAFCDAFASLLAAEIAMPLAGSLQIQQAMLQRFQADLMAARAYDAGESSEKRDSIIDARS